MITIVSRWAGSVAWLLVFGAALSACGQKPSHDRTSRTAAPAPPPRPAPSAPPLSLEEKAVLALLEKYGNVEACVDRIGLILHGEANRATVEKYYKNKTDCQLRHEKVDTSACKSTNADGYCYPVVRWRGKNHDSNYCIVKTPEGYLVDWRCTVAFNPVPLVTFTAQHTLSEPSPFRLRAQLSDVYKAEFAKATLTHHSLLLRDRDGKTVQGYITRSAPDGQKIFDELRDGKEHPLIVELAYPKASTDPTVVEVRSLIGTGYQERPEELVAKTPTSGAKP